MIHTLLITWKTEKVANTFSACLFRDCGKLCNVDGKNTTIPFKTKRELKAIEKVADMFHNERDY